MQEQLDQLIAQAAAWPESVRTRADLEAFKARLVGPKGDFTQVSKSLGQLPKEERPTAGKLINQAKKQIEAHLAAALSRVEENELAARLGPPVDPTLPSPDGGPGTRHLLTQVRDEMTAIFRKAGFIVEEATEIETEWYCFDALNTPEEHPARDEHDTYYLQPNIRVANVTKRDEEAYLLRSHTSTVQIRTMLKQKPPVRMIAPGRCFRRDTPDATHGANFHQLEGLYIDRNVTVRDLKAMLDYFVREFFGAGTTTRLRPSFFPFTEPSFEVDVKSPNLGKLSNRWIEVMGCGMVDPAVLETVGLDPQEWTGYAWGMGIERLTMLLYGIDDIRYLFQNDLRFLRQFA